MTGNRRILPVGGWMLAAAALALLVFLWWIGAGPCRAVVSGNVDLLSFFPLSISTILFSGLGIAVLIVDRNNAIGWLLLVIGVAFCASLAFALAAACRSAGLPLPGGQLLPWTAYFLGSMTILPIFVLLPMLFPDGRFLSPFWRRFVWFGIGLIAAAQLILAFLPGEMRHNFSGFDVAAENPLGLPWLSPSLGPPLMWLSWFCTIVLALGGIAAFVVRFRHSTGDERQQLKWFAYFMVVIVGTYIVVIEGFMGSLYPELLTSWIYQIILLVVFWGFPIVIGVAVFKYRLYDIDLLINRTLVYGSLTALLAAVYFGSIIVLQRVFTALTGHRSDLTIVFSTLVIAVLFNPLRLRLQNWIDRRFYRRRYDAEKALQSFARMARDEANLDRLTAAVAAVVDETVQPAGVVVWLLPGDTRELKR